MAPCTHPGTSREVDEARGGLILAAGRVRSKKKKIGKKNTEKKSAPHPKHTTKSTAARRPRPTRDGMRRNTSHALAHPGLVEIGLVQLSQFSKNDECYTYKLTDTQTD